MSDEIDELALELDKLLWTLYFMNNLQKKIDFDILIAVIFMLILLMRVISECINTVNKFLDGINIKVFYAHVCNVNIHQHKFLKRNSISI